MPDPVIRIDLIEKTKIRIRTLRPERLTRHGFGTFLENIQPGEISISQQALDAFHRCTYKPGLQGMEIFAGKILAWGVPMPNVTLDLDRASRHDNTAWLTACCVVEAEPKKD